MAQDDIPKLLKKSKKALASEHAAYIDTVKQDLESFKKNVTSTV